MPAAVPLVAIARILEDQAGLGIPSGPTTTTFRAHENARSDQS